MNCPRQLEYRTLTLLDALAAGRSLADADPQAALFRAWPGPPRRVARQLAAQANAARGRDVLWLVGVEPDGNVRGADPGRFDDWLAGLLPLFDGLAPRITAFHVPTGPRQGKLLPKQVVALHVETDRAPFVIRGAERAASMEVPWLDAGGGIRSAGRLELVKLLSPLQDLPQLEILEAELTFYKNPHPTYSSKATFRWTFDGSVYVMPRADDRVVIPLHRVRGGLATVKGDFSTQASEVNLTADKNSPAVRLTDTAVLIEGLGRVFVYCAGSTTQQEIPTQDDMTFTVDMGPASSDRTATASTTMRPAQVAEGNQAGRWKL